MDCLFACISIISMLLLYALIDCFLPFARSGKHRYGDFIMSYTYSVAFLIGQKI